MKRHKRVSINALSHSEAHLCNEVGLGTEDLTLTMVARSVRDSNPGSHSSTTELSRSPSTPIFGYSTGELTSGALV